MASDEQLTRRQQRRARLLESEGIGTLPPLPSKPAKASQPIEEEEVDLESMTKAELIDFAWEEYEEELKASWSKDRMIERIMELSEGE